MMHHASDWETLNFIAAFLYGQWAFPRLMVWTVFVLILMVHFEIL